MEDYITKEVAMMAMENGGYKVSHRSFISVDYIYSIDNDYYRDSQGYIREIAEFIELYSDSDYDDGWIIFG